MVEQVICTFVVIYAKRLHGKCSQNGSKVETVLKYGFERSDTAYSTKLLFFLTTFRENLTIEKKSVIL